MSTKDAYKQKIEAEVELAQARLAEFKAHAKGSAADARIKYAKQVEELEQGVDAMKTKLQELGEANEDAWGHLKDEVESAWDSLKDSLQSIVAKVK